MATASSTARVRDGFRPIRDDISSGGSRIAVEWFAGAGPGRHASVLMLHGADGLAQNGERYRDGARKVAAHGHNVALLHYLDRTAERRASFATMFQHFVPWLDTVRDALAWLRRHPDGDPERIGILGISLGGLLGLAAANRDGRVKALVDCFAPVPAGILNPLSPLPPTLILHGAADPVVPVANSYLLRGLLESQGVPHEIEIYPGQGHGFRGAAQDDADRRIAAFLDRYLAPTTAASPILTATDRP